jgi:deoxyribose-phosphate aldolase
VAVLKTDAVSPDAPELAAQARAVVAAFEGGVPPSGLQQLAAHEGIQRVIDHTLLRPEAGPADIETLCAQALEWEFAAVCVNGAWVSRCAERLHGSGVRVVGVVGFPLGAVTPATKAREARELVDAGADELDMAASLGHIRSGAWREVEDDIRGVVGAADGRVVKVIVETAALEPLEIVTAALVARRAGAAFAKTSTGFNPSGGATVEAVALLRHAVGGAMGVKAAGGIRDCVSALRMLSAGANRLGTSAGIPLAACLGRSSAGLQELVADPDAHLAECTT